jgi:hypothetical protein
MALKALLDNLDDVPEALHVEYVKKTVGGKEVFVLDVAGIDDHPSVKNLKTAHEAVKTKRDEYKTQLETATARLEGLPEDFNADKLRDLQQQAEGKGGKVTQEQIDAIRADERKKVEKDLKPIQDRNGILEREVRRRTIDDGLTQALLDAGVTKEFLPAARALLKETAQIELVEDNGRFVATVDSGVGPQKISEFVGDWVGTNEGKAFIGKATGGDAQGGNGKKGEINPFEVKDGRKPNLTDIQNLVRDNPQKALQFARAAGVPEGTIKQYGLVTS